jgi:hypothetical protein
MTPLHKVPHKGRAENFRKYAMPEQNSNPSIDPMTIQRG